MPVPPAVVTESVPLVAPVGTVMLIEVAESTLITTLVVPMVAAVTPPRLVPVMVMTVPTAPEAGVKLVIWGATWIGVTVKLPAEVPVPAGLVTLMTPVVAVAGTAVMIDVAERTV